MMVSSQPSPSPRPGAGGRKKLRRPLPCVKASPSMSPPTPMSRKEPQPAPSGDRRTSTLREIGSVESMRSLNGGGEKKKVKATAAAEGGTSRRLVEYFVVVSSVPKRRLPMPVAAEEKGAADDGAEQQGPPPEPALAPTPGAEGSRPPLPLGSGSSAPAACPEATVATALPTPSTPTPTSLRRKSSTPPPPPPATPLVTPTRNALGSLRSGGGGGRPSMLMASPSPKVLRRITDRSVHLPVMKGPDEAALEVAAVAAAGTGAAAPGMLRTPVLGGRRGGVLGDEEGSDMPPPPPLTMPQLPPLTPIRSVDLEESDEEPEGDSGGSEDGGNAATKSPVSAVRFRLQDPSPPSSPPSPGLADSGTGRILRIKALQSAVIRSAVMCGPPALQRSLSASFASSVASSAAVTSSNSDEAMFLGSGCGSLPPGLPDLNESASLRSSSGSEGATGSKVDTDAGTRELRCKVEEGADTEAGKSQSEAMRDTDNKTQESQSETVQKTDPETREPQSETVEELDTEAGEPQSKRVQKPDDQAGKPRNAAVHELDTESGKLRTDKKKEDADAEAEETKDAGNGEAKQESKALADGGGEDVKLPPSSLLGLDLPSLMLPSLQVPSSVTSEAGNAANSGTVGQPSSLLDSVRRKLIPQTNSRPQARIAKESGATEAEGKREEHAGDDTGEPQSGGSDGAMQKAKESDEERGDNAEPLSSSLLGLDLPPLRLLSPHTVSSLKSEASNSAESGTSGHSSSLFDSVRRLIPRSDSRTHAKKAESSAVEAEAADETDSKEKDRSSPALQDSRPSRPKDDESDQNSAGACAEEREPPEAQFSARPPSDSQRPQPPAEQQQHSKSLRNIRDPNLDVGSPSCDMEFHAEVTARYPPLDRQDNPLNAPMLPHFCHPSAASIEPTTEYRMPTIHHFVLTNARGDKLYGTCLTVYEEYVPEIVLTEEEAEMERRRAGTKMHSGGECGMGEIELTWTTPKCSRRKSRWGTRSSPCTKRTGPTLYLPKVLCLLSTWPYLTAFREYLSQLYRLATLTDQMKAPIERYILNICEEVPAPPPGAFEIQLSLLNSVIRFWAPPANQPIPYVALPFRVLFECLDLGNVLYAWYALALERKVLLVSSQYCLLTLCGEILCSLLFPMQWSHLYIPVLPRFLSPMLDAPMPYLCGIGRDHLPHSVGDIGDETIVVDLDRNVITMGPNALELPPIPRRRRVKLEAALDENAGQVFWAARGLTREQVRNLQARKEAGAPGAIEEFDKSLEVADRLWEEKLRSYDEAFNLAYAPDSPEDLLNGEAGAKGGERQQSQWDAVQEAFLRFYVSVLKDYKRFLKRPDTSPSDLLGNEQGKNPGLASSWRSTPDRRRPTFDAEEFAAAQRPDFQPFLNELILTQQFDDFIAKRMYDPGASDVIFFDQSIAAKHNRSRLKLKKVDTLFLVSANAHKALHIQRAVEPSIDGLAQYDEDEDGELKNRRYVYKAWPEGLDASLYVAPRPVPEMINAEFDRQSALADKLRANNAWMEDDGEDDDDNFWEMYGEDCSDSPEVATFTVFFIVFTAFVGRDLRLLEAEGRELVDTSPDKVEDSFDEEQEEHTDQATTPTVSRRSLGIVGSRNEPPHPWTGIQEAEETTPEVNPAANGSGEHNCFEAVMPDCYATPDCPADLCDKTCGGGSMPEFPDYQATLEEIKALLPTYQCTLDDIMGWGCSSIPEDRQPGAEEISEITNASSAEESSSSVAKGVTTRDVETRDVETRDVTMTNRGDVVEQHSTMKRFDRVVILAARFEEAREVARAQLDLGCSVLTSMTKLRQLSPDPDVYKCLMGACGKCGDADRATELMGMVRNDGLVADSEMYSCYVEAFSSQGSSLGVNAEILASAPLKSAVHAWVEQNTRHSLLESPLLAQTQLSRSLREMLRDWVDEDVSTAVSTDDSDSSFAGTSDCASSTSGSVLTKKGSEREQSVSSHGRAGSHTRVGSGIVNDLLSAMSGSTPVKRKRRPSQKKKKKKPMPLTDDVKKQLSLGENLLNYIYPDVSIDTSNDSCPQCSWTLSEDEIVSGWSPRGFRDFTCSCPQCKHRFVPRFSVMCSSHSFVGSQGPSTPLYCEFLSPWVLRKELQHVLESKEGIDGMVDPEWRSGNDISATLWWNMIVSFKRYRLPVTFLLQGSFRNQLISPSPGSDT